MSYMYYSGDPGAPGLDGGSSVPGRKGQRGMHVKSNQKSKRLFVL